MKTKLLLLLFALASTITFAQNSKKNTEKVRVPACTVSGVSFMKGDTIAIGQPSNASQKFFFLHRRFAFLNGIPELEKFRLSAEWSSRLVLINETYMVEDGLNKICYAEFIVGKDFHGWITLDNAIKAKEIVKLNNTDL
jgi:hypothetical protein